MPDTIVHLNPRLRKQALFWGILIAVVGAGSIIALVVTQEHLNASPQIAPQPMAGHMRYLLFLAEAGIMVPVLSLTGMLSYLASKIWRSGQYPPPGMQVLRDTKIRTGRAARNMAGICLLLAVVVVLCGIGMGLTMAWLLSEPDHPSSPPMWQSSALLPRSGQMASLPFDGKAMVVPFSTSPLSGA
jgi:hypothetical protein